MRLFRQWFEARGREGEWQARVANLFNQHCAGNSSPDPETIRFGRGYSGAPLPTWLSDIAAKIPVSATPDAVAVNRYQPGRSIAPHIDSTEFGDDVAVLSLGAPAVFVLVPPQSGKRSPECQTPVKITLPSGSLLILSGTARYKWKHGVEPVGALRYSLAFRKFTGNC